MNPIQAPGKEGRRFTWSLTLDLGIVASAIFAGSLMVRNLWPVMGPPVWSPALVCDEPTWEFGDVDAEGPVVHRFVIRNGGSRPLSLALAATDCRCTKISPEVFPQNVIPQATLEITARLDVRGIVGPVEKHLLLTSNDPRKPRLTLTLRGTVKPTSPKPLTPVPDPAPLVYSQ